MDDPNSIDLGPPPLSVRKVRMSRQVFGDLVADEGVQNQSMVSMHSLCYSPSPVPDTECQTRDAPTPMAIMFEPDGSIDESEKIPKMKQNKGAVLVGGPFKNIIGDDNDEKENQDENSGEKQTIEALPKPAASPAPTQKRIPKKAVRFQPKRQNHRSALSRDRGLKTQTVIKTATDSVNKTLNAVRKAKEDSQRERARQTSRVRRQWKEEKVEAKEFYAIAEKSRREILSLQKELSSKFRKQKANTDRNNMRERLNAIEKESQFKSKAYRDQQRKLKEDMDRRKRMSIEARAKLRQNHREGEERMKMASIAEDQALIQERHESSIAIRETKKSKAELRRKSFQFRNGDARRIRQLYAKMEAERLEKEHSSFELKWGGEKDAEAYKKQLADDRRKSLAFRNKDGHRQRELEANMHHDEKQAEHESYELKWGGEKDAEAYKKQLADDRRKSLAFRNKERARHEKVMNELKGLAKEQETESLWAKWSGENDAKEYVKKLEEERRKSLQFRNEEGKRHREIDAENHCKEIEEMHEDENLRADDWRDIQEYRKACSDRDRASLCFRRKEANLQRLEEDEERQRQEEIEEKNRKLEDAARSDVKAYIEDCKRRRRMSLANRAKEKRRHAKWERDQAELEQQRRHRETRNRALDRRYVELAKQKELARIAMDAIRHAGCSFNVNPFAAMLD